MTHRCWRRNCSRCPRIADTLRHCHNSQRLSCNNHYCHQLCHNPNIPNSHCMASQVKKASDGCSDSDDEGVPEIIQCPYSPSFAQATENESDDNEARYKRCCARDELYQENGQSDILQPGFKAHISVDIGSEQTRESIGANRAPHAKSLETSQQFIKPQADSRNDQQCRMNACCKSAPCPNARAHSKSTQQNKLSSQGVLKLLNSNIIKASTKSVLKQVPSQISNSSLEQMPCCARAYSGHKLGPPLPPKGIQTGSRPGYVINNDTVASDVPSNCISTGCIHGINSIMPNLKRQDSGTVVKSRSLCSCSIKLTKSTCDSIKPTAKKEVCPCRYPPGYSQFSCVGNITGNCNCTVTINK